MIPFFLASSLFSAEPRIRIVGHTQRLKLRYKYMATWSLIWVDPGGKEEPLVVFGVVPGWLLGDMGVIGDIEVVEQKNLVVTSLVVSQELGVTDCRRN